METNFNTGWRRLAPGLVRAMPEFDEITKEDLYTCRRAAERALSLKAGPRALLNALVGFYGGEPIAGRLIVWPSNEILIERTGLSERAVRFCIRNLIDHEVVRTKESANGKRFAIRSKAGQIVDAYGLDLSPLIERRAEFETLVERQKDQAEDRSRMFDRITICRRAARQAIVTLNEWFSEIDTDALESAFDDLERQTPRRSSLASPESSLREWESFKQQCEAIYSSASGGKNSRLIENNTNAPDQSCYKGYEENGGGETGSFSLVDLSAACPDAFRFITSSIRTGEDLARAAAQLRGGFGTHRSAWEEACEKLGPVAAGAVFFVVLQSYSEDQAGKARIANFGGYFRAFVRMVADDKISLADEVRRLKQRRTH